MSEDARALIDALPNPALLVGQSERILAVNPPATALIGLDCQGLPYITALRQPVLLDAIEATLQDGEARNTRYLGKDGARDTTWDVAVRGVMIARQRSVLVSFQDQTALEDADAMRREFVANVSHEMRTPLTSLQGFIETLRGPAKDDEAARDRFLTIMDQEAGRMHRLVEDLLSLSRVEAEERIRPTTTVVVQTVIGEVVDALSPMAQSKNVTLLCDLPADPVKIVGDASQLWQVIRNLVENAIKYGADGGDVQVGLTMPAHEPMLLQDGVQITVRDGGIGIPAHHIARLTERFYRIDSHRSREVGGTGLGLAIVKHMINRHRGRLRITSTLGQGTEFKVILPISHAQPRT